MQLFAKGLYLAVGATVSVSLNIGEVHLPLPSDDSEEYRHNVSSLSQHTTNVLTEVLVVVSAAPRKPEYTISIDSQAAGYV